jgi:metacaspase-1
MGKRAICVGINRFKRYPQFELRGCVNDARDMAAHCRKKLGFKASEVTLLTDARATKAAIVGALKSAIAAAKKGRLSKIVFTWSSHGTQTPDLSGDEPDGMDEAFVPYDIAEKNGDWDPKRIITDDELHDLFQQLPDGVALEVFLDTCHSGTGLRGAEFSLHAPRVKFVAPPSRQGTVAQPAVRGFMLQRAARKAEKPATHQILWTGCKASQTSADAYFDGRYSGAFTYCWLKAVADAGPNASRSAVLTRMRAMLKGNFSQVPQLETNASNRKTAVAA